MFGDSRKIGLPFVCLIEVMTDWLNDIEIYGIEMAGIATFLLTISLSMHLLFIYVILGELK